MVALSSDFFQKVGSPGSATTLSAPGHLIGGTSITVVSTANHPTDTGYTIAMDTVTLVNGKEVRNVGTYTEWSCIVSGATSITTMVLRKGTDQDYPAGATTRVYIPVAASQNDRMVDGLLVEHKQDGKHSALTADSIVVADGGTLEVDIINEATAAAGVTIDSLNIKDGKLNTNNSVVTTNITDANVTTAKIYNPYKCSVYLNNNQNNIAQNVVTRVGFDIERFDVGNNYDAVTDKVWIAPVTGYYFVNACVSWRNLTVGEIIDASISVQGITIMSNAITYTDITFGSNASVSGLVYMTAGQYMEITTKHDGAGATQDISAGTNLTYMQVFLQSV